MTDRQMMRPAQPVPPDCFSAYECWKCKQHFRANPEEPPPPHHKPGPGEEWCIGEEEWRTSVEECP